MSKKRTAAELERQAAASGPPPSHVVLPPGDALAMLVRRGFRPEETVADLPFPRDLAQAAVERLAELLGHYAVRLFLRGAIQRPDGFTPVQATRYLKPAQARGYAEELVELGLAERLPRNRYRLVFPAATFGGTLEWYVSRELARKYGFDVATGVKLHVPGVGGDLDVIAAAEGKLIYLELKSSPPKNLSVAEVGAFLDRVYFLRPDVTVFVVDTALRLSDKVLPMLLEEFGRRRNSVPPARRIGPELWALTPHVYLVNGRRDLMNNIGRAIAEGLRALSPKLF